MEENEDLILYDWLYKPNQLCHVFIETETGNKKVANVFCRKVFNLLIQAVYNYNIENKDSLDENSLISIELDYFMEKLRMSNFKNLERSISSIQKMSITSFHSKVKFESVCLIPYISINYAEKLIEFTSHKILINMMKSKFKLIDENGNIVNQEKDNKNSMYYTRMYVFPPKELKNSEYGVMSFYEYIISSKDNINDKASVHSINTERFLNIVGAKNSTKNSEIITILNRIINRLEDVYGLKVFYKCNRTKTKYNRISSISLKVYMTDKNIEDKIFKYKMHLNPYDTNNPEISLFFPIYNNEEKPFKFKSNEDFKIHVDSFLTNMLSYTHVNDNKIDKLLEGLM